MEFVLDIGTFVDREALTHVYEVGGGFVLDQPGYILPKVLVYSVLAKFEQLQENFHYNIWSPYRRSMSVDEGIFRRYIVQRRKNLAVKTP